MDWLRGDNVKELQLGVEGVAVLGKAER